MPECEDQPTDREVPHLGRARVGQGGDHGHLLKQNAGSSLQPRQQLLLPQSRQKVHVGPACPAVWVHKGAGAAVAGVSAPL